MTASPEFSRDLAELASPWTPTVAPSTEAEQPFFVSPVASPIPEFEVYGDVARASSTYFGHVPSTGPPPRSRVLLLIAAIASISAVVFLVRRCFALLRDKSSLRVSGSSSRQLAEDDDVFTCSDVPEEADESSGILGSGEQRNGASEDLQGYISGIQASVHQQLDLLILMRPEAQALSPDENTAVAKAQGLIRSLISKYKYHTGRISGLSGKLMHLKREQEELGQVEDDEEETEAGSVSARLMAVEEEMSLEETELENIKQQLESKRYTIRQDVMALFKRAEIFASGRFISSTASQALAAQAVVLGTSDSLPTTLTSERKLRVDLLATELLLQSSSCRRELERVQQEQSSIPVHSKNAAAAMAAPITSRARMLLIDLQDTASHMRQAGMQSRAQDVQKEAERMIRALEGSGVLVQRSSPRTMKRDWRPGPSYGTDFEGPLTLWRPLGDRGRPWQRSPSAELFLPSDWLDEDSSSSSGLPEHFLGGFQTTRKFTASSRSVDSATPRPRQSKPTLQGTASPWGSPIQTKRLWRSFPEISSSTSAELSSFGAAGAAEAPAVSSERRWRHHGVSQEPSEDYSEESSDATSEQELEHFWITGALPSDTQRGHHHTPGVSRREMEGDVLARKGLKEMSLWISNSESAMKETSIGYLRTEQLRYQIKKGQSITSAWSRAREDTAASRMSLPLVKELRERLIDCEKVLERLTKKLVDRALDAVSSSEEAVNQSIMSLKQGLDNALASDLNRFIFGRIIVRVADTIMKSKTTHTSYCQIMREVPEASSELSAALLRLARISSDAANMLADASTKVPPGEKDAPGEGTSTRGIPAAATATTTAPQATAATTATITAGAARPHSSSTGPTMSKTEYLMKSAGMKERSRRGSSSGALRQQQPQQQQQAEDPDDSGAALMAAAEATASAVLASRQQQ